MEVCCPNSLWFQRTLLVATLILNIIRSPVPLILSLLLLVPLYFPPSSVGDFSPIGYMTLCLLSQSSVYSLYMVVVAAVSCLCHDGRVTVMSYLKFVMSLTSRLCGRVIIVS